MRNLLAGGPQLPGAETEGIMIQITEEEVGRALRTRRWNYAVAAPDADPRQTGSASRYYERYLYDLEADPWELRNLIAEPGYDAVREQLRAELAARMAAADEGGIPLRSLTASAPFDMAKWVLVAFESYFQIGDTPERRFLS